MGFASSVEITKPVERVAAVDKSEVKILRAPIRGPDAQGKCWQGNINGGDIREVTCPRKDKEEPID